jgi:hypothetical protein
MQRGFPSSEKKTNEFVQTQMREHERDTSWQICTKFHLCPYLSDLQTSRLMTRAPCRSQARRTGVGGGSESQPKQQPCR